MLPLEKQVCAIEYSKKLAELGVRQNSIFYWSPFIDREKNTKYELVNEREIIYPQESDISAFTTAELGVMLPIETDRGHIHYYRGSEYFHTGSYIQGSVIPITSGKTEADVRADTLIRLIESKLITVSEINDRI